jgi:hypothetical protein
MRLFPSKTEDLPYEKDAWRNYRMIVAAQEAEEARARRDAEPGPCFLCGYCLQMVAAAAAELPLRVCCHTTCACCAGYCAVPCGRLGTECGNPAVERSAQLVFAHHCAMMTAYNNMYTLVCTNLLYPCEPVYLYMAEVALIRPERPPLKPAPTGPCGLCFCCMPGGPCDCCVFDPSNANSCCSSGRIEEAMALGMRTLRSLLCVLGGTDACHPSLCCGPCGPWDTYEQRLGAYQREYATKRLERTRGFYARAEAEPSRYAFYENKLGYVSVTVDGTSVRNPFGRSLSQPQIMPVAQDMARGGATAPVDDSDGLQRVQSRFTPPPLPAPPLPEAVVEKPAAKQLH